MPTLIGDSLPEPPAYEVNGTAEPVELARLRYMLQVRPERADIRLRLVHRLYDLRRSEHFAEIALPLRGVLPVTPGRTCVPWPTNCCRTTRASSLRPPPRASLWRGFTGKFPANPGSSLSGTTCAELRRFL